MRRIEAVEKDLQALTNSSASKEEISKVRAEVKKLYDGLHVEFLDLRSHVWGIRTSPCSPCSLAFQLTPLVARQNRMCTSCPRKRLLPFVSRC